MSILFEITYRSDCRGLLRLLSDICITASMKGYRWTVAVWIWVSRLSITCLAPYGLKGIGVTDQDVGVTIIAMGIEIIHGGKGISIATAGIDLITAGYRGELDYGYINLSCSVYMDTG